MKFVDSWKISTKILAALMLLALAFAVSATYSSIALKKADNATKALVAHRAPAALELARVGRMVNVIGYATYRVIAEDGPTPGARQAKADIETSTAQLRRIWKTPDGCCRKTPPATRRSRLRRSRFRTLPARRPICPWRPRTTRPS